MHEIIFSPSVRWSEVKYLMLQHSYSIFVCYKRSLSPCGSNTPTILLLSLLPASGISNDHLLVLKDLRTKAYKHSSNSAEVAYWHRVATYVKYKQCNTSERAIFSCSEFNKWTITVFTN